MTALALRRHIAREEARNALESFPDFEPFKVAARVAERAKLPRLARLCRGVVRAEEAASVAHNRLSAALEGSAAK